VRSTLKNITTSWTGGLRLDVAPFVIALENATGTRPIVLGKPAAPFYQAALDLLGEPASNAIMVGDDIRGDVEGAQRLGIHGILVKTVKFQPSDLELDIRPYAVLDSVANLPGWWTRNQTT
jgi:ribonucleotide monophosphatase NagD (HAD superfamily)